MTNDEYRRRHIMYHMKKLKELWEREEGVDEWGMPDTAVWKRYIPMDVVKHVNALCAYEATKG